MTLHKNNLSVLFLFVVVYFSFYLSVLLLVEAGRLAGARAEVIDAPLAEAVAEVQLSVEWGE